MPNLYAIPMRYLFLLSVFVLVSCSDPEEATPAADTSLYFPPRNTTEWETVDLGTLGWNESALPALERFITTTDTRALIILKHGRIAYESYAGMNLRGTAAFDQNSYWYWASAAKTLTSFLIGQAEAQELLSLNDPSSQYLGRGWSSLSAAQEEAITVGHHLTMTTGLDYQVAEPDCTDPECLQFLNAPGAQWFYHNGPYTLLDGVISGASNQSFEAYFEAQLLTRIGMEGFWEYAGYNHLFFSPPRSMARFGLLVLAEGMWNGVPVLDHPAFWEDMLHPSQALNPSYGYLWWLNGQGSFIPPGTTSRIPADITPAAPDELVAAIGRNGQLINIVPSQNLVIIRMGNTTDTALVPFNIQSQLWEALNELIVE